MPLLSSHHQHEHTRRHSLPYRRLHGRVEAVTPRLDNLILGLHTLPFQAFSLSFH